MKKILLLGLSVIICTPNLLYAQTYNLVNRSHSPDSTGGYYNSFFGDSAGALNAGAYNSFFGYSAGASNDYGNYNTFLGALAGYDNSGGNANDNTFLGYASGIATTGPENTFLGSQSGSTNTSGRRNVYIGTRARLLTNSRNNVVIGYEAGDGYIPQAPFNTMIGYQVGNYAEGGHNTFIGREAGYAASGSYNTYLGGFAGVVIGSYNVALGYEAGASGNYNVALGNGAGSNGSYNVALGNEAGYKGSAGGNANVFLGYRAGYSESGSNKLYIENDSTSVPLIYGDFATNQVGIDTKSIPTGYSFAVAGKIAVEEVLIDVQTNWPDYVFNVDYDLPTIKEVETFIAQNGHLKDIPSAGEVQEHGILQGEMDAKLLKKIEELTLYIIELNNTNTELKERVQKLEETIKSKTSD